MEIDDEMLHVFFDEANGLIEEAHAILKNFDINDELGRNDNINAIYRCVHTIKGGASMLEMRELTAVSHEFENKLSEAKKDPTKFDVDYVTKQIDVIENLLNEAATKNNDVEKPLEPTLATSIDKSPDSISKTVVAENNNSVPKNNAPTTAPHLIRVPLDRIQRSYDITSEIFLLRNQIAHLLEAGFTDNAIHRELFLKWEVLDNSLRQRIVELESAVLSMRMMSVKSLFSRMEKTVRAYCETSNKEIRIKVSGEETEIDKRIIDTLADPMIHLIRNAMDHGIELPLDREKLGKARYGTITMDAKIVGNEAVIRIKDDGKGIDAAAIVQSAKAKGIDVSAVASEQDALQLIFAPGFSTAQQVSEVSGRGVGMDVVKTYIEKSDGSIHVETKIGVGTTFSLHLPIGLSIIPLIVVGVGEHIYGIPTHDIIQTYTLLRSDIILNQNQYLLNVNDQFVECIFIADCFDKTGSEDNIMGREIFVCLAKVSDKLCAFVADKLISNTELIVKALPAGVPSLPYLQGVSILITGVPAFILSLERLHKMFQKREVTVHATTLFA